LDQWGNHASYTGTMTFSTTDGRVYGLPGATQFVAADNGCRSFSGFQFRTVGTQSVSVSDSVGAAPSASLSTMVLNAAASQLRITTTSTSWTPGLPNTITVTALDPYGNVDDGYNASRLHQLDLNCGTVYESGACGGYRGPITFSSNDNSASLPADFTLNWSNHGAATFNGVVLRTPAAAGSVCSRDKANSAIAGCLTVTVADTHPPTWPVPVLRAARASNMSATLSWSPATDDVGVTAYRIYQVLLNRIWVGQAARA